MSEVTRRCFGECRKPGVNRKGYKPTMEGNFVVVHEFECDGKVKS